MNRLSTLPPPFSTNWDWQLSAACRGMDGEVFFRGDSTRGPTKQLHEAQAKAVCVTCPVRRACLEWALRVNEPFGVWGGCTPKQRKELAPPHAA